MSSGGALDTNINGIITIIEANRTTSGLRNRSPIAPNSAVILGLPVTQTTWVHSALLFEELELIVGRLRHATGASRWAPGDPPSRRRNFGRDLVRILGRIRGSYDG